MLSVVSPTATLVTMTISIVLFRETATLAHTIQQCDRQPTDASGAGQCVHAGLMHANTLRFDKLKYRDIVY